MNIVGTFSSRGDLPVNLTPGVRRNPNIWSPCSFSNCLTALIEECYGFTYLSFQAQLFVSECPPYTQTSLFSARRHAEMGWIGEAPLSALTL